MLNDKLLYWTNKRIEILEITKNATLTIIPIATIDQKPMLCLFATKDTIINATEFGFTVLTLKG